MISLPCEILKRTETKTESRPTETETTVLAAGGGWWERETGGGAEKGGERGREGLAPREQASGDFPVEAEWC